MTKATAAMTKASRRRATRGCTPQTLRRGALQQGWFRQLALGLQRGDRDPRQARPPVEGHVAGRPARRELLVEGQQALDLEDAVERPDDPHGDALEDVRRLAQPAPEGAEVQRQLLDALLAQQL